MTTQHKKTHLERIMSLRSGLGRCKGLLRRAVSAARKENISWARIAAVLGVSKQGAMKQYSGPKKKDSKATKVAVWA